ncbi:DUF2786 domain-containing protein [Streptomyces sp. SCSIO 30461]|uniref:DUF2786 domain-containing protein n=1 Tax=Streptomyces sp. SCSIO 30461 TaxID=3118085 RepID=UPI0030CE1AA2
MDDAVEQALGGALYADGDDALDTGASLLAAAPPAADAEVVRRGAEFVRRTWERGWQPADLARFTRRELTDTHAGLVAELITSETRRYGQDLPPRWAAQLAALRAETAGGARHGDRFSRMVAVLELYRLLVRLPALEPAGPVPGASFPRMPPTGDEPRMLVRVRGLLAKAEATGFPEEAEALTAKAQELMVRYSIDEALLRARTHRTDLPGACRIGVDAPYEQAKAILLDAVARANRCRAVWNSAIGFSTVVGFEPDLDAVELLFTSLLVQGTTAMTRSEAAQRAGGRKRTKTFRQSFLLAYADRLGSRLAETAAAAEMRAGEGAGAVGEAGGAGSAEPLFPVLAAREVAVAAHAERLFPTTVSTRVRGATDADGWHQGRTAADDARMPWSRNRSPSSPQGRLPG